MIGYVAVIHKEKKSDYGVSFPDFPGCITAGETLEEAKAMAKEALEGHMEAMKEAGFNIPAPSSLDESVQASQDEYKSTIHAYIIIEVKGKKEIARFNATMEVTLLSEIDMAAKAMGLTRSGLLAQAAKEFIHEHRQ